MRGDQDGYLKRWAARVAWAAALVLRHLVVGRAFESQTAARISSCGIASHQPAKCARRMSPPGFTLTDYLAREDEVFSEVARDVSGRFGSRDASVPNRYVAASVSSPTRQAFDGNRTFERVPAQIRGGALLVHGLTDAPYSLHAVADLFASQGLYALSLRMPGHGTVPAALTSATWEDWMAAVRVGMRHVRQRAGEGRAALSGRLLERRCAGGEVLARRAADAGPAEGRPTGIAVADDRSLAVCAVRLDDERLRLGAVLRAVALARRASGVSAFQVPRRSPSTPGARPTA